MPTPSSTVELANVTLTVRDDLRFSVQHYGDDPCYLIEDERNSRFYRIGIPEYAFLSLLDGTTTVREAIAQTSDVMGADALSESDAAGICKWLIENQLAFTPASSDHTRLWEKAQQSAAKQRWQRLNPLVLRLPLLRPDRMVTTATSLFGWWFTWPAFGLWLLIVALAVHQLMSQWSQLPFDAVRVLTPGNLVWLLVVWCVMKVVHEFSHGIACKKFGGHVREAGVMLIVFAPIPYVDVTSSWRCSNKYQRMMVSAAGMYSEILLAAAAAIIWVHAEPGVISQQAYNVMITASLTTVLFNANPLMRFDGYYILADFVEIPNLYSLAQQSLVYLGKRYAMGVKVRAPLLVGWKRWFTWCYAISSFWWRALVSVSILLTAAVLFEGIGIALALLGGGAWFVAPVYRLIRYLIHGSQLERPQRWRFAAVASTLAAVLTVLWMLPEPVGVTAPGVVAYVAPHVIRAPYDSFVRDIPVHDGIDVAPNDQLATVSNPEMNVELVELEVAAQQSRVHAQIYRSDRDIAAAQAEAETRQSLQSRALEQSARLAQSTQRSTDSGRVVRRDVGSLVGTFLEEGEEILTVADERQKEIRVFVAQDQFDSFSQLVGEEVSVVFTAPGFPRFRCPLEAVDPRGTRSLSEPALSAEHGGPLPVQPLADEDDSPQERAQYQLVDPRFPGTLRLSTEQSVLIRAGQTAIVRLGVSRGSIGQLLVKNVRQWFEKRLRPRDGGRG